MSSLPRLVVAAPATGQGKTTIATGLMAALRRAGHEVSGHKVGPDYIDPGYHALATGRPGRNLDPHLVGPDLVAPLLLHGARGADVAVIEGVMGLYDGRIGQQGFSSTAHVAALVDAPVLLVVDISRASRSIGAVVHGMATYALRDGSSLGSSGTGAVRIGGVVLNQAGSPRHAREVEESIDLPVLGVVPRDASFAAPSRHLGLVPAAERAEAADSLSRLADVVAERVDLDAVLALARTAPPLDAEPWDAHAALVQRSSASSVEQLSSVGQVSSVGQRAAASPSRRLVPRLLRNHVVDTTRPIADTTRPVVAVAGGRAFTFRYAETDELLRAAGLDPVAFDPTTDTALPRGTCGLYLGGGFPEVHASALSDNASLRAELLAAVEAGVPTVAECAGLLYLCRTLDGAPMVGALDADATMSERLTLRYPAATAVSDSLLGRAGEVVTGHEFHRTVVTPGSPLRSTDGGADLPARSAAWEVDGERVGFASDTLHASYLHTHWAGHPRLARHFADAVHARAGRPILRGASA